MGLKLESESGDQLLVERNRDEGRRTVRMRFMWGERSVSALGDPRVSRVLTEVEVVDPIEAVHYHHEAEQEPRDRTFMRLKEIWIYICAASMTTKYIVASVMITRANAENLSEPLLRYVYQTTVRIADMSVSGFSVSRVFWSSTTTGAYGHLPKMVPIVLGINLNWRFLGPARKAVMSAITNLANASVAKKTTSSLFLREIAHTLK